MVSFSAEKYGTVGVVYGGKSAERKISINSGNAVVAALNELSIDNAVLDGIEATIEALQNKKIDRLFNVLHGQDGEDGVLQGLAQAYSVPVTGSSVLGCALTMNKFLTKLIWQQIGLLTPRCQMADITGLESAVVTIGFPVVLKPIDLGSSVEVVFIGNENELVKFLSGVTELNKQFMVEEYVAGRELTVAMANDHILPPIEIKYQSKLYDYHAKYESNQTEYICPAQLDQNQHKIIQEISRQAFNYTQITGWGRLDFMMTNNNKIYLLEVNSAPGMTKNSLVPIAARNYGWSFQRLVLEILESTLMAKLANK